MRSLQVPAERSPSRMIMEESPSQKEGDRSKRGGEGVYYQEIIARLKVPSYI